MSDNFYKSKQWLDCRRAYISNRVLIDGAMCERCHRNTGRIVHHKVYLSEGSYNDPQQTVNFSNLELLCQDCHNKEHFGKKEKTFVHFDANGNMIPVDNR